MCYSPPGPRCSYHARRELIKAEGRLRRAEEAGSSQNQLVLLEYKKEQAQAAYNSTPRGQRDLLHNINVMKADPEHDEALLKKAQDDLEVAIILKNQQMQDYEVYKLHKSGRNPEEPTNKQELAQVIFAENVHAVYSAALEVERVDHRLAIVSSSDNPSQTATVLVIPQKQQSLFTKGEDQTIPGRLSKPLGERLELCTNDLHRESRFAITNWVIEKYKAEGIEFFASVDTKLRTVYVAPIESLGLKHDMTFKQKKRLGGTYIFPHGNTPELVEELAANGIAGTVTVKKNSKGENITVLTDANKLLTSTERHLPHFYLAEQEFLSQPGKWYEIRKKHEPKAVSIFLMLQRKNANIEQTDMTRFVK